MVISVCALFLCLNWHGNCTWLQRVFQAVSENSFGIYLLHMMPALVLRVWLPVWFPWLYSQGGNVLAAAVIIAICVPISMLIRRIPLIRWLLKP